MNETNTQAVDTALDNGNVNNFFEGFTGRVVEMTLGEFNARIMAFKGRLTNDDIAGLLSLVHDTIALVHRDYVEQIVGEGSAYTEEQNKDFVAQAAAAMKAGYASVDAYEDKPLPVAFIFAAAAMDSAIHLILDVAFGDTSGDLVEALKELLASAR